MRPVVVFFVMSMVAFVARGQTHNPNSDYFDCHEPSPPGSCALSCGPNAEWCDFAGWRCTWDDKYFFDIKVGGEPAVKDNGDGTGTYSFQDGAAGWFGSGDEADAIQKARLDAAAVCAVETEDDLVTCYLAQDTCHLNCVWADVHCIDWASPTQCIERSD